MFEDEDELRKFIAQVKSGTYATEVHPYRGPERHSNERLEYICSWIREFRLIGEWADRTQELSFIVRTDAQ
jgi:hypothetical protein